jgi:hypothetical protein
MREPAMQVQACTGPNPASVRLPQSELEAYFWLSPFRPNQSLTKILHALKEGAAEHCVEVLLSRDRLLGRRINIFILTTV